MTGEPLPAVFAQPLLKAEPLGAILFHVAIEGSMQPGQQFRHRQRGAVELQQAHGHPHQGHLQQRCACGEVEGSLPSFTTGQLPPGLKDTVPDALHLTAASHQVGDDDPQLQGTVLLQTAPCPQGGMAQLLVRILASPDRRRTGGRNRFRRRRPGPRPRRIEQRLMKWGNAFKTDQQPLLITAPGRLWSLQQ